MLVGMDRNNKYKEIHADKKYLNMGIGEVDFRPEINLLGRLWET